MTDKEFLGVVWSAINCEVKPIEIMHAIEKRIGKRELNKRWAQYFDDKRGTKAAIRADLKYKN